MRGDDDALQLLFRNVGKSKDGPVTLMVISAGANFDAPDDAVGAGRRRDLEGLAAAGIDFRRRRQVECGVLARNLDRFRGKRSTATDQAERDHHGGKKRQEPSY
jgi:hypothetical protein